MALVPMRPVLEAADRYHYAQGAFNVNAVHQAKTVIETHEMFRSPAILQGADLANGFMGGRTDFMNATLEDKKRGAANIAKAVKRFAERSPIPVVLHLDHGRDLDSCAAAIAGGYTSVMIDGSSLPFEENIALTREVVRMAHAEGVTVEGELGVLSGVDALAISYGTKHGANKGKNAVLRKEIAIATKECLRHEGIFCALVSHGSSTVPEYIVEELNDLGGDIRNAHGIPREQLMEVSRMGISKINVDTDIRLAVTRNLRELFRNHPELRESASAGGVYRLLKEHPGEFDPRVFLPPVMDTVMYGTVPDGDVAAIVDCLERGVREVVGTLVVDFGSVGRARLVEPVDLVRMAERYRKEG